MRPSFRLEDADDSLCLWVKSMKIILKLDLCPQSFLEATLQCWNRVLLVWVNVGRELRVVTREPSTGPRIRNGSSVFVATL